MLKEHAPGNKLLEKTDGVTEDDPSAGEHTVSTAPPERPTEDQERPSISAPAAPNGPPQRPGTRPVVALFCYEEPGSSIGHCVASLACALVKRKITVHIFSRTDFELESAGVTTHPLGPCEGDDLSACVQEFASRACNAFLKIFQDASEPITPLGYEWSSIPAVSLLRGIKMIQFVLLLHSMERQRTDMTSEISQGIEQIELAGLREARDILVHDQATEKLIRSLVPECSERVTHLGDVFPAHEFDNGLDPGAVKTRYEMGPLDPVILFVGDLEDRYGPDSLVKAMPAVLKNHKHAKLVIVGDGSLYWPMRVYARYLLIEHAVRFLGGVEGQALRELFQAADLVIAPSRADTPWWAIQAAWASRRPLVATHCTAPGLLEHERDSVLTYPNENSCVWGIERVLYDAELRKNLAEFGYAKLYERFGWGHVAAIVEQRLTQPAAR